MTRARAIGAALLVPAALALTACGKTGRPVAPERRLPAAVGDLHGLVRADGIELVWTLPSRRVDGTPLRDLAVAHIYRTEDTGAGEPRAAFLERGRIRGYAEVATVRLAEPAPATIAGGRATLVDRAGLTRGRRYTYVVLSEDATRRVSPPSIRASLTFIAPPEPPRDLVAEAGDGDARLTWAAPALLVGGRPVAGTISYEVLRRTPPETALSLVTSEPIREPTFVDRGLANDQTYEYAVRAILTEGTTHVLGDATATVAVTPTRTTPVSPPRDLVAIPSPGTVRLSWLPSPEADIANYVIYRGRDGGELVRVGSVTAPTTAFTDRDVPPGRYRYAVTAEDSSPRRRESARSNEASVSVP